MVGISRIPHFRNADGLVAREGLLGARGEAFERSGPVGRSRPRTQGPPAVPPRRERRLSGLRRTRAIMDWTILPRDAITPPHSRGDITHALPRAASHGEPH